ncbi:MAG: shikimate dehydrogenase [Crenarchaeota archaeon]|nr:MAG: shikimate dehydrogenase [Thermoproteota archaeon]RDJ33782.1 MAG: shikimate dehydrogenase [Thermoproteota archaeon]RDJ37109.1 MAG: shikimate dehydrogenase [Thermoproteota archaeon]
MVKTYAVIGDPIDHSLSPNIHNAAFKELNMDCTYIAYRIPKGELLEGLESLKKINISGFNVTIPHKVEVMKYIDKVDEDCSLIGAANTISNENNVLKGYNTDMEGFLDPLHRRDLKMNDFQVLLLGAGGAARAITAGLVKEDVKSIMIANRTRDNANSLAQFANKIGMSTEVSLLNEIGDVTNYDLIINATSIGLKNEPSPIPTKSIRKNSIVYDIVYNPMNTDLIKGAKEKGATIIYGYEMLLGQAIRAFEIWHKTKAPYEVMKKAVLGVF